MVVKQLFNELLPQIKKRAKEYLSMKFSGQTIGVDISIWLHQAYRLKDVVMCFILQPQYNPEAFLKAIQKHHCYLINCGITPFYVFDGKHHPVKLVKESCKEQIKQADTKIVMFYEKVKEKQELSEEELLELNKIGLILFQLR